MVFYPKKSITVILLDNLVQLGLSERIRQAFVFTLLESVDRAACRLIAYGAVSLHLGIDATLVFQEIICIAPTPAPAEFSLSSLHIACLSDPSLSWFLSSVKTQLVCGPPEICGLLSSPGVKNSMGWPFCCSCSALSNGAKVNHILLLITI